MGRETLHPNRNLKRALMPDPDSGSPSADRVGRFPPDRPRFTSFGRVRRNTYRPGRMRPIRIIKVSLTVLAAALIALLVLWPQLPIGTDRLRIAFADLEVTGDDLSMINARYVGTDHNNRPFSITADAARHPVPGHGVLNLESPQADISLQDESWIMVTADEGVYDVDKRVLNVSGTVRLFHDSGYEFLSSKVDIDLEQNIVSGPAPITGQGPFGELEGEGFRFSKDGKSLMLTGKSRLKIYPGAFGDRS